MTKKPYTEEELDAATFGYTPDGGRMVNVSALNREENLKIEHGLPLGAVVEVDFEDSSENIIYSDHPYGHPDRVELAVLGFMGKARMIVVHLGRDCDGSPLYGLAMCAVCPPPDEPMFSHRYNFYRGIVAGFYTHGWSEGSLKDTGVRVSVRTYTQYMRDLGGE